MNLWIYQLTKRVLLACAAVVLSITCSVAWAADRHAGYYYPEPQSTEIYKARVKELPNADRRTRIAFVTGIAAQQQRNPYAPTFHLFAKGEYGEKLIIVATGGGHYQTVYQLRGLLASLTAIARSTPVFLDQAAPENLTFLDLCKMLGVTQLTLSDGDTVAHQFKIQ